LLVYLKVTLKVSTDGTLGTADRDLTMKSERVETAEHGKVETFRARISNNGVDAFTGRVEIHQIHRRLRHK